MNALPRTSRVEPHRHVVYPESDGRPMGETDLHIGETIALRFMLLRHFHNRPDALVASNLLVYYAEGDPTHVFCPDVFVAFGVGKDSRGSYRVWAEGAVPAVVIEVSSRTTWLEDEGNKKALCARLGVAEYWLYDPGADYLRPPLQGFRLAGEPGRYERIERDPTGASVSEVMGLSLDLDADRGRIILRHAVTGHLLLRPEELAERLQASEAENEQLREEIRRLKG